MATPVNIKYQVNNDKLKAIYHAIEKGDLSALTKAYDKDYYHGRATKETDKKADLSKLLLATLYQNPQIVSFLAKARKDGQYDLHHWNADGQNPLIEAIKSGQVEIIKIFAGLIAKNHEMLLKSFKDDHGNTPFHYIGKIADANVRKQMATALIHAGMRIDFKNDAGEKPEHHDELVAIDEAYENRFINSTFLNLLFFQNKSVSEQHSMIKILPYLALMALIPLLPNAALAVSIAVIIYDCLCYLAACVNSIHRLFDNIHQLDADLYYTIKHGKLTKDKLLQYLEQEGASLRRYEPIILKAARAGYVAQLSLLLEHGVHFDRRAVHQAITHGHLDAVRFLISKAKAKFLNEQESPKLLVAAVYANKPEILAFLLAKGAKIPADVREYKLVRGGSDKKPGKTAISLLDFAKSLGHKEIITMLEKAAKPAAKAPAKVVTPNFTKEQQARKKAISKKPHVVEKPTANPRRQSLRSAKSC